jgi:hypothetical protein
MMIRRNLLSKYASPLTFFLSQNVAIFSTKSICTLCTIFFLCCHNAKIQPKNTLILQMRIFADPFKFKLSEEKKSFLFSSKKLKSNSIAMLPNPYVLFNEYKRSFYFIMFFLQNFSTLFGAFPFTLIA